MKTTLFYETTLKVKTDQTFGRFPLDFPESLDSSLVFLNLFNSFHVHLSNFLQVALVAEFDWLCRLLEMKMHQILFKIPLPCLG